VTRSRWTMLVVGLVLVAAVVAGWYFENHAGPGAVAGAAGGSASKPSAAAGAYRVRITRDGHQLASYDLAAFEAMGMRSVVVQGGSEQGPPLLDMLRRAGAGDFSSVTVLGAGTHDSGRLDLPVADIGPDTVLDIAKRGTVKIAGPAIPYNKRVRDITEIQVK
jgi:hypothetical protein